jgi:redox-sensitive bicupin YhaK (pirin superfamily)
MQMRQESIVIRPAAERGRTSLGWLESWHSFSFGRYVDRSNIHFGPLRVINDDIVAPGRGFGRHPHENMEIVTWMLSGSLAHTDSTGSSGTISPGEVQLMTAGRGIEHSEMNASATEPAHLLQIWIVPDQSNLAPGYQQRHFPASGRLGKWQTIASPAPENDSALLIHQDATLRIADLPAGRSVGLQTNPGRKTYVHVAYGSVSGVPGDPLKAGDAFTAEDALDLSLTASQDAQLLWFDLP